MLRCLFDDEFYGPLMARVSRLIVIEYGYPEEQLSLWVKGDVKGTTGGHFTRHFKGPVSVFPTSATGKISSVS